MSIEMNQETCVAILAVVAASALLGGCHMAHQTEREAIKAGLIQQVQPGSSLPRWVRPDGENK